MEPHVALRKAIPHVKAFREELVKLRGRDVSIQYIRKQFAEPDPINGQNWLAQFQEKLIAMARSHEPGAWQVLEYLNGVVQSECDQQPRRPTGQLMAECDKECGDVVRAHLTDQPVEKIIEEAHEARAKIYEYTQSLLGQMEQRNNVRRMGRVA